jgi:hypothetical protein
MVVIQRLMTDWTKRSRGGSEATARNAVPQALILPAYVGKSEAVIHEARFLETDAFRCRDELTEIELNVSWQIGAMTLCRQHDSIVVQFAYRMDTAGAPERWSRNAFALRPGKWGRLLYNGRFSGRSEGEWWYRQDVFNIACTDLMDRRVFIDTTPNYTVSEMARLR